MKLILAATICFLGAHAYAADSCTDRTHKIVEAGVPLDLLDQMAEKSVKANLSYGDTAVVINYGLLSREKRFFAINLKTGEVEKYHVSQGKGNGKDVSDKAELSNAPNSHNPPNGLLKIEGPTVGRQGQ